MKSSSKIVLALVAVLFVVLASVLLSRQPTVSDQDQIAAQLESARTSVQSHNAGGVMNIVSADFKGPTPIDNVDRLNLFLHHVLGGGGEIQVTLSPPDVVVQGDTATSTSQVTVRETATNQSEINQPLTLSWRREDGRRYLVFPIKVWRVVGAQYQGDLSQFD